MGGGHIHPLQAVVAPLVATLPAIVVAAVVEAWP
jgi:hypothetical protein